MNESIMSNLSILARSSEVDVRFAVARMDIFQQEAMNIFLGVLCDQLRKDVERRAQTEAAKQ